MRFGQAPAADALTAWKSSVGEHAEVPRLQYGAVRLNSILYSYLPGTGLNQYVIEITQIALNWNRNHLCRFASDCPSSPWLCTLLNVFSPWLESATEPENCCKGEADGRRA